MGRKEPTIPPGPSPRPEQMTEKDQRQLREYQRGHKGKEKEEAQRGSGGKKGQSTTEE